MISPCQEGDTRAGVAAKSRGVTAFEVRRFKEKPDLAVARKYLASRNYFWNAGMFFWRVLTFMDNLKRFLPATHDALAELGKSIGTPRYARALKQIYLRLENISVDYAIMEPVTRLQLAGTDRGKHANGARVSVIPAKVGWSDIGSWAAVYELLATTPGANVSAGPSLTLDASGNYFWAPNKFVAAIGVRDLVLVETGDALLLCSRERSQDVGKIVKWLEAKGLDSLY